MLKLLTLHTWELWVTGWWLRYRRRDPGASALDRTYWGYYMCCRRERPWSFQKEKVHYDTLAALLCELCTHLSVILVQPFKLSSSMFLQFWEKVLQKGRKFVVAVKLSYICLPIGSELKLYFLSGYSMSPQGTVTHTQAPPQAQFPKKPPTSFWDVLHHPALQNINFKRQFTQPAFAFTP